MNGNDKEGILVVLVLLLVSAVNFADAQLSVGTIQSALEDETISDCEFVVIAEGMYKPVRLEISYPQTSDVSPKTQGLLDLQSEFNANFGDTKYSFESNATENFQIEFRLDYPDSKEGQVRNVFYEFITEDSVRKISGNWQIEGTSFCKIIDFWTSDAPESQSAEDIARIFNEFTIDQYDTLTDYAISNADILVVIGMIILVVFLVFVVIMWLLWKKSEQTSKESVNIKEIMKKSISKFDSSKDKLDRFVSFNQIQIDNSLRDLSLVAHGSLKEKPKEVEIKSPIVQPKKFTDKIIGTVKDVLPKKKEENLNFRESIINMSYEDRSKMYNNYLTRYDSLSESEKAEFKLLYSFLQDGEPT